MNGTDAIELKLNADDDTINLEKFWKMADDLFYTKVYYDADTQEYFTKHYKNSFTQKVIQDAKAATGDTDDNTTETTSTTSGDSDDAYELEVCTEDEINTLLVSFITLVSNYCDPLIAQVGDDVFFNSVAEYLMHFKYYQTHIDFCIRKMLSLLIYSVDLNLNNLHLNADTLDESMKDKVNEDISTNEKFIKIIGWIFRKHYENYKKELLEALKEYNGFVTLCKVLQNYIAISQTVNDGDMFGNSYKNYMSLTFDLCKNFNFADDLKVIQLADIVYLFDDLKVQARDENEINFLKFRLLLVLNEQYMFQCGLKLEKGENVNYIVDAMIKKITYFQVFNETLILNFNREMDRVDQILMLKFLYVVFSNKITNNLVYLNDLKVISDIIIRQLFDLQLAKSEYLVNIYIRVLHCILTTTDLKNHDYKKEELVEVLEYIISSDEATDKTKNLAKKCIGCSFFVIDNHSSDSLPSVSSLSINQHHNRAYAMSDKQILHKIGQETAHALMNPAATLISIPTHIIQNVARAPVMATNVATNVATHIITTPYKVANNLMPYFDSEPGRSPTSGASTPPPPPPRSSRHPHSQSQQHLQPPQVHIQTHQKSASTEARTASSPPPPPPPPRPYLRGQNASANDVTITPQSPGRAPLPPLCRRAVRRGSMDGNASVKSGSTPPTPTNAQSPLPPPPPPRSRIARNTNSDLVMSSNNTGSNDSELQKNSGCYSYSDTSVLHRYRNERAASLVSVNSMASSENGDVVQVSSGRQKRAPPPPPR